MSLIKRISATMGVCSLFLMVGALQASDTKHQNDSMISTQERPKIGLVLSGGGAKGAAHIGVLQVLEANKIPVDYIAGTSIGAYVGGMYALGFTADEIENIMLNESWDDGYSDTIPREDLSFRDKQIRDKYNIPINVGFNDGKLTSPSGLLVGQTMSQLLRNSTDLVEQFGDFDELSIPFRAVTTDLATSEAVVLSSGSVVQAMQASATVPGALQPANIDGRLLVDGGIANNMPVDVVKAMGADIVIAVDIGSPLARKEALNRTIAVLNQLSTMLTNASTIKQKALLEPQDILIRPSIDNLSTTDFSILQEALVLGEKAAQLKQESLIQYAVSDTQYAQYSAEKKRKHFAWVDPISRPVVKVEYVNDSKVHKKLIEERLGIVPGQVVTKEQLNAGLKNVYALDEFEKVDAEFEDVAEGRVLTVRTKEKSWGPNYFNAGFNWEDDFSLDSAVTLSLAYTLTNLTDNGGEWRNELALGFTKYVSSEFYQPLDRDQTYYSASKVQYEIKEWNVFDSNERLLQLENKVTSFSSGLGYNLDRDIIAEVGFLGEFGNASGPSVLVESINYDSLGGYFKIAYDTLDSISFPTQGNRLSFATYFRDERYDSRLDIAESGKSWQFDASWKGAVNLGNHIVVGKLEYSTINNDDRFSIHFSELGGFLNLSGFHKGALAGSHKAFGAAIYQYDLAEDLLVEGVPIYLGTSLEAGNIWYTRADMDIDDLIFAGSLYLGTDTSWGPGALGIGFNDRGEKSFYLFVGKNF